VPQTVRAPNYAAELAVATDAARQAGRLQVERYERLERIERKGERDVVTEVDTLSEALIIDCLRQAYPNDAVLAEESGHSSPSSSSGGGDARRAAAAERTWVIDPLDGTINYANGIPVFCVSIGLAVAGVPVVGAVYDPLRDELFSAIGGHGAWLDGQAIHQPVKDRLADLVLSWSAAGGRVSRNARQLRKRIRVTRNLGSAALALAYVGNGRFDGFIQIGGLSAWDICAAGLIAAEGGATVTARDGGPWFDLTRKSRSMSLVAAAPGHHATLLELLA
jgi:myo-inositol-1(or 4)-monophosphatase